jgi:predicted O-methyltransferase YrrM
MNLLEAARQVQGHMSDDELQWLHDTAKDRTLVIEFGSWCGRSSLAMASAQRLLCVDTWMGSPGEECEKDIEEGRIDPWAEWRKNLGKLVTAGTVKASIGDLRSESLRQWLIEHYAHAASMVFIDASHDEASVREDIALARDILAPGGILCGHDYGGSWTGVKAAVDVMVKSPRVVVGSIWVEGE